MKHIKPPVISDLEREGLELIDYLTDFDVLTEKEIRQFIKEYGIEVEINPRFIKEILRGVKKKFSAKGYKFDLFIKTAIDQKGENVKEDFSQTHGLNLTPAEIDSLGVLVYYFETVDSDLDGDVGNYAGDIVMRIKSILEYKV